MTQTHGEVLFLGLIRIGHEVFLPGDQFIGLTTDLYRNPQGQITHLAIRTARLFGRHKVAPVETVMDVTTMRILLSINRDQFIALPAYPTDVQGV